MKRQLQKKLTKVSKPPTKQRLTRQQERFVQNMANPAIKNQTEAAIKAGCPAKNARITASKWLTKSNVLEVIEERKKRIIANADVNAQEILGSAVFNMRSSIDDLLDENGSFDIEKARETGAIDLVKKYRTKTTVCPKSGKKITTTEVEMYSAAEARREVATYIGLEKIRADTMETLTETELALKFYSYLIDENISTERALEVTKEEYPNVDLKLIPGDE